MTTGASALDAAAVGVYGALNVAGFTALSSGGVHDVPPQGVSYPYTWFTLQESIDPMETFGKLGSELDLRLQVFDLDGPEQEGFQRIDQIISKAAELLHHVSVAATGWVTGHLHYVGTQLAGSMRDEQGRVVRSKIARFRWLLTKA